MRWERTLVLSYVCQASEIFQGIIDYGGLGTVAIGAATGAEETAPIG